jgi:glycosyltransferase involved in cell wall biosynthesis
MDKKINKDIIITGDFFRFAKGRNAYNTASIQDGNIKWFGDLFGPLIQDVTGVAPKIYTSRSIADELSLMQFMALNGHDADFYGWLATYNRSSINPESLSRFKAVFDNAFIIGFELSPFLRTIFNALEVPWLNFSIHPVRFAPDLLMRIDCSDDLNQHVEKLSIPISQFARYANYIRAGLRRSSKLRLVPGAVLFCGQVLEDASLINERRMVRSSDYFQQLKSIAEAYPHLYYKRHPHAVGDNDIIEYIDSLPNATLIEEDIYELLSLYEIDTVVAISSGTLFEANIFGKNIIRLLDNRHNISKLQCIYTLGKDVVDTPFWSKVLSDHFVTEAQEYGIASHLESPIQLSLSTDWKKQKNSIAVGNYPVLELGRTYGSGVFSKFLLSGWWQVEKWGVWMSQSEASLRFRVEDPISIGVKLKVVVRGFSKEGVSRTIRWQVSGQQLATITIIGMEQATLEFDIPKNLIGPNNTIVVKLITEDGFTPNEVVNLKDYRLIHMGLVNFYVRPIDGRLPISTRLRTLYLDKNVNGMPGFISGWMVDQTGNIVIGKEIAKLHLRFIVRPNADIQIEFRDFEIQQGAIIQNVILELYISGNLESTKWVSQEPGKRKLVFRVKKECINADGTLDLHFKSSRANFWGGNIPGLTAPIRIPYIKIGNHGRLLEETLDSCWIDPVLNKKSQNFQLDNKYLFTEEGISELLLGKGWSKLEEEGHWSICETAHMQMFFDKRPNTALSLQLQNVSFFAPENDTPLGVKIYAGNIKVLDCTCRGVVELNEFIILIPPVTEAEELNLTFEFDHLKSPKLSDISIDSRFLGIRLEGLSVVNDSGHSAEIFMQKIEDRDGINLRHAQGKRLDGINIVGQNRVNTGMGVAARNLASALSSEYGTSKISLFNYNLSTHNSSVLDFENKFSTNCYRKVNIFLIPPPVIENYLHECGASQLDGSYSICYGAWELENLPSRLSDSSLFDEYWGISQFVADSAKLVIDKPVIAMPLPVDFSHPDKLYNRSTFGLDEDRFYFLFTYCVDSTVNRKNPMAVIRAFQKAFPKFNSRTGLVLKAKVRQANASNRELQSEIREMANSDDRIILIEENMSICKVKSLYINIDCYVSLHRSEGFGLTIAEAMGYGKPTIATGYSGNLDFMNKDNSCLVDYELIDFSPDEYHGQNGQRWADPDVSQAAMYMQKIFEDNVFRSQIARQGMYDVWSTLSFKAIAKKYANRLKEIEEGLV